MDKILELPCGLMRYYAVGFTASFDIVDISLIFKRALIMLTLTIRQANLEEIPTLKALIEHSARGLSLEHYTSTQVESALTWVFGVDTQLIEDGTYYVVLDGDTIAACGGWSRRQKGYGGDQLSEGPAPLLDPAVDAAKIRAFFVHPDYARRGIGRKLLANCEQAARAEGFSTVEMVATLPGKTLYAACGYISQEPFTVPFPNGDSLPCIMMTKLLD